MKRLLSISTFMLVAHGCSEKTSNDDDTGGTAIQPDDIVPEEVESEPLFDITGALFDLATAPDGRVFASIEEHAIDVWDPTTQWVETHTDRAGPVFGIEWADDALWYTTSSHRQAGALLRLEGKTGQVIAEAQDDTVFREPRDLCRMMDGKWVVADTTLGLLFAITADGSSVERITVPLSDVATVTSDSAHLYVGGEDGVVQISWPNGTPEMIDDRPVDGLHAVGGTVWGTNADWGVFEVAGDRRLDIPGLRRAGRMAGTDPLLIADPMLGNVWAVDLSSIE